MAVLGIGCCESEAVVKRHLKIVLVLCWLEWMTLRALCTSVTITGSGGACQFSFCASVTDMWHGGARGGGEAGVTRDENRQK